MLTSNNNQNSRPDDPEWYFLAQYSLKVLPKDGVMQEGHESGLLFTALTDLGIELQLINSIERTLIGFARGAMQQLSQERNKVPVFVRVFCQTKALVDVASMKSSDQLPTTQITKSTHDLLSSDPGKNGGWGYFLVKRGGGSNPESTVNSDIWIDFYLYKE